MIGILGGTFDPIHFGHIKPALDLLSNLSLDEIRFIPVGTPPHRSEPQASAKHRWEMLKIVTRQQPGFIADDRELNSGASGYTVDTLAQLRSEVGEQMPLCWIMGADVFATIEQWHKWQQILDYCHIIITARPGCELPHNGELGQLLERVGANDVEELRQAPHGRILACEVSLVDVSATQIRRLIAAGAPPRYLLPGPVWNYIQRHRLYGYGSDSAKEQINTRRTANI